MLHKWCPFLGKNGLNIPLNNVNYNEFYYEISSLLKYDSHSILAFFPHSSTSLSFFFKVNNKIF